MNSLMHDNKKVRKKIRGTTKLYHKSLVGVTSWIILLAGCQEGTKKEGGTLGERLSLNKEKEITTPESKPTKQPSKIEILLIKAQGIKKQIDEISEGLKTRKYTLKILTNQYACMKRHIKEVEDAKKRSGLRGDNNPDWELKKAKDIEERQAEIDEAKKACNREEDTQKELKRELRAVAQELAAEGVPNDKIMAVTGLTEAEMNTL